jgi:hypothetical protein
MRKIISLFKRDYEGTRLVYDEVVPGAEWALRGEGMATRKWDGTCCMVRDGRLYKRYSLKRGRTAPPDFEPATGVNEHTGKQEGWVPVGDGPEDRWHREAWETAKHSLPDGTYELVGPKVQGNPEGFDRHYLLEHGVDELDDAPRTYAALAEFFDGGGMEGIVWHHPDGRMVKIKARDFGVKR